jgi:hypothetical protein
MRLPLKHFAVLFALTAALICTGAGYIVVHGRVANLPEADVLALLLPDGTEPHQAAVREWMDAAQEEGLHLQILYDSDLLNPASRLHVAGIPRRSVRSLTSMPPPFSGTPCGYAMTRRRQTKSLATPLRSSWSSFQPGKAHARICARTFTRSRTT